MEAHVCAAALHGLGPAWHSGSAATWGYQTFSDLWDESYDLMPDLQRMHAVLDNIQSLTFVKDKLGWLAQVREICEHNQAHFMRQDWFNSPYHSQFMAAYQGLNS